MALLEFFRRRRAEPAERPPPYPVLDVADLPQWAQDFVAEGNERNKKYTSDEIDAIVQQTIAEHEDEFRQGMAEAKEHRRQRRLEKP